jgi:hypothetical protein
MKMQAKTRSNLLIVVYPLLGGGCPSEYHLVSGVVYLSRINPHQQKYYQHQRLVVVNYNPRKDFA